MAIQVIFKSTGHKPGNSHFFLARQPILDRRQEPHAFDLLIRAVDTFAADIASEQSATAFVFAHFVELKMSQVVGDMRGFVDIDANALMGDIFQQIPSTQFVFTLTDKVEITEPLVQRIAQLAGSGFVFALEEALLTSANAQKLLPLVQIIKCDLHKRSFADLVPLTAQVHATNKKLLVVNVEKLAQFETCLALGFDYFQGYYFIRPVIEPAKELTPSQLAIIDVITLIATDADSAQIEECIKRDVSLGLNLLRLVNTAAVGTHRIDSLRQALLVLGRNQLLSWMQVMLYAQPRDNSLSVKPLLMLATTRGKLLELIAQRHKPGNRSIADTAFTVGIMSLMDALFSLPMAHILKQIAVVEEVSQALLDRQGYFGDLLNIAECTERTDSDDVLLAVMDKLQLSCNDLYSMQAEAFEWSNNIARAMHG